MNIEDYIRHFDKIFNTDISSSATNRQFPMLELAFDELAEQLYSLNSHNRNISKNKLSTYMQLEQTLSDEQKKLLDKYFEFETDFMEDTQMQMLTFGFCLCYEQLREMNALKT